MQNCNNNTIQIKCTTLTLLSHVDVASNSHETMHFVHTIALFILLITYLSTPIIQAAQSIVCRINMLEAYQSAQHANIISIGNTL